MANHPLNLALRFLLEIAAVFGFGYWGWQSGRGSARWGAALALPLLAMLLWGTFRVPGDPVPEPVVAVPGALRLMLEFGLFSAAVAAYLGAGARTVGWTVAALVVLHYGISHDRVQWLLGRQRRGDEHMSTHDRVEARTQPALRTERLLLRPFTLADGPEVQRLAGDPEVSATAVDLPYPFEHGMAEAWIRSHAEQFAAGTLAAFAVTTAQAAVLYGAAGLMIEPAHRRAELGYWLGKDFWGRGYATEAADAVIRYGFEQLGLHRIHANHLVRNPGSGRVLQKLGMRYEGCLRQHAWHRGAFEDLALYGILRAEATSSSPVVIIADRTDAR